MQIDYRSPELNNNTHMLQVLMKDLFERKPEVRYDQLCNQIEDKIVDRWLRIVNEHHIWDKPVKCIVRFVERVRFDLGRYSLLDDSLKRDQPFTLTATLDSSGGLDKVNGYFNYKKRVLNALTSMRVDLCKHDLDNVQFDLDKETGHEYIKIVECHDA